MNSENTLEEYQINLANVDDYADDSKKPEIKIISMNQNDIEFEIKNISVPLANAMRRILLSEIPTIAAEKLLIANNSSIIQDEVLCSRLGLVPIYADPTCFVYHNGADSEPLPESTIVFELKVKGKQSNSIEDEYLNDYILVNRNVYTRHLKWIPIGNQSELFASNPPRPVHDDILLAKLAYGEEISIRVYCRKGIGQNHAKFSPVATAAYRMMPKITFKQRIFGDLAFKVQSYFSSGVVKLFHHGDGQIEAILDQPQRDSMSLNVTRDKDLKNMIEITRAPEHFIFNVESTGCVSPQFLIRSCLGVLIQKCEKFIDITKNM